jgi:predicted Rossmann fold flavoprotein
MISDVVIIGAGASGLMCAMEAGRRGKSVAVLDHSPGIGRKILVSGGGRCNFTNRSVSRQHYISGNPHFPLSALSRYTPEDFVALLDNHGIGYHEREAGQLFCDESSQQIVRMLKAECERVSVKFILKCTIQDVQRVEDRGGVRFAVHADRGVFDCRSLVVATGGLSWPKLGATNFGHALARKLGIRVTPLRPALTPVRFSRIDEERFSALSGISIESAVRSGGARFVGDVLFTHRGLSGPAILQLSSYWDGNSVIEMDLTPKIDLASMFLEKRGSRMHLANFLGQFLPDRLARLWCELQCESRPLCQYTAREIEGIAHRVHHWEIRPAGTEGFNKAEVTLGGVDTREISSKTMECRQVPGLYFTGEVLDVTGQLGGYNLHWAWASGHAAGQAV